MLLPKIKQLPTDINILAPRFMLSISLSLGHRYYVCELVKIQRLYFYPAFCAFSIYTSSKLRSIIAPVHRRIYHFAKHKFLIFNLIISFKIFLASVLNKHLIIFAEFILQLFKSCNNNNDKKSCIPTNKKQKQKHFLFISKYI